MESKAGLIDAEELMHLAMGAIDDDDPERSMGYLKRVLDLEPSNGTALYLLGAVHAGLGMHERAIEEINRALELEPDNPLARFQLGMLYVMCDLLDEAVKAWRPLEDLGENEPLYLFKRGLESFMADDYPACVSDLTAGLERNLNNPSLNDDMEHMLSEARKALEAEIDPAAEQAPDQTDAALGRNALLSAYRDNEPPSEN